MENKVNVSLLEVFSKSVTYAAKSVLKECVHAVLLKANVCVRWSVYRAAPLVTRLPAAPHNNNLSDPITLVPSS